MKKEVIGDAELYLGDCLEILPQIGTVDSIITDPPYSQRTHSGHDKSASGHDGFGKDNAIRLALNYQFLTGPDVSALSGAFATATDGWIVWMHDHALAPQIHSSLKNRGRYVFAPLPYYAPGSRVRLSGDGPSSWTIWITVCRTSALSKWGTLPGGYIRKPGWDAPVKMGGKPVALMSEIIRDYTKAGQTVCDPCMGLASTGIAAVAMGRKFIGIEKDPDEFLAACERIDQAQRQQRLVA